MTAAVPPLSASRRPQPSHTIQRAD
jgi:hypothetical protein